MREKPDSRRLELFVALLIEKLTRLALDARMRAIGQAGVPDPAGSSS
jgi:hypothetical protein